MTKLVACIVFFASVLVLLPTSTLAADGSKDLRKFLLSIEGTYGWQPTRTTLMYDFFPDGRLAVQGPDGEATMWEGTWKLEGDQLTMNIPDLKVAKTVAIKQDGDALILEGERFTRYKP